MSLKNLKSSFLRDDFKLFRCLNCNKFKTNCTQKILNHSHSLIIQKQNDKISNKTMSDSLEIEEIECKACNLITNSIEMFNLHLNSLEHLYHLESFKYLNYLNLTINKENQRHPNKENKNGKNFKFYFKCKLCNFTCKNFHEMLYNHASLNENHKKRLDRIFSNLIRNGSCSKQSSFLIMRFVFGLFTDFKTLKNDDFNLLNNSNINPTNADFSDDKSIFLKKV